MVQDVLFEVFSEEQLVTSKSELQVVVRPTPAMHIPDPAPDSSSLVCTFFIGILHHRVVKSVLKVSNHTVIIDDVFSATSHVLLIHIRSIFGTR